LHYKLSTEICNNSQAFNYLHHLHHHPHLHPRHHSYHHHCHHHHQHINVYLPILHLFHSYHPTHPLHHPHPFLPYLNKWKTHVIINFFRLCTFIHYWCRDNIICKFNKKKLSFRPSRLGKNNFPDPYFLIKYFLISPTFGKHFLGPKSTKFIFLKIVSRILSFLYLHI